MAPAIPPNDEGNKTTGKHPPSPRRPSTANKTPPAAKRSSNNGVATPAKRNASAGQTPKSAPAAAGPAPGQGGVRKASKKQVEPTLLGDFLLGRPSPARQAAARRKSIDAAAVKQELRQQMRQEAVRKVPQPNGVQNRVKAWQKANASAMVQANPEDAASEPTEVAAHIDEESVTEEDRVRIKMRQQKAKRKSSVPPKTPPPKDEPKVDKPEPVSQIPPKKRIVSDDNWMKRNKGNAAPKAAGVAAKLTSVPPKLNKPVTVQDKISKWAMKVELPPDPLPPEIPTSPRPTKEYNTKCGAKITVEESASNLSGSAVSGRSRGHISVQEDASSSSSAWKTESARSGDDGIRVRPIKDASPQRGPEDGIRVKQTRTKAPRAVDDGIRVRPVKAAPLPDDGIRVRPIDDHRGRSVSSKTATRKSSGRVSNVDRDRTPTGRTEVTAETETEIETPPRKPRSPKSVRRMRRATAPTVTATESSFTESDDDRSWTSGDSDSQDDSDKPSSAPPKSLADVPFGYSAFSELELPVGADHHHIKRPKPQRESSFNAVPKAFKKIMTGAKEIVQDRVDPPKPVVNQPPSIESWLNGTVDPFVDKSAPKGKTPVEKTCVKDADRRPPPNEASHNKPEVIASATTIKPGSPREDLSREDNEPQGPAQKAPTNPVLQPPIGLKRSRATRASPTTTKPATVKTPFREALNNLFRGESSGHKIPTKAYSSYQDMSEDSEFSEDDRSYQEYVEDNEKGDPHVLPRDPHRRSPSPESSYVSTDVSSNTEGPYMTPAIPRRRPPPTNGQYELSTILSEESGSTIGSETSSILSDSTVTQTTALTRSTAISRRKKGLGSKRRLTKHSDLVSVLSLPDDEYGPSRTRSVKSTSSLRRRTSNLEKVTVEDLLQEFSVDEDMYQRELKTLVDGAVPVLLRQVVQGSNDYAAELFGPSSNGGENSLGKSVVNMGIALEKLRSLHRRAPLHDVHRILTWVLTAYPAYDRYLDVWRLGFEGIIVNLALAPGGLDDEDSLVNAMPRNADGDVVDTKGQPVDLQHLLTRPLARIRGLLKLLRGARAIGSKHPELELAIEDFTCLHQKARRRHREEIARKTDEDANNTDTSRCCDLRTMRVMEGVLIDPSRQVNAKDFFTFDMYHSNGQRLECQVELIFRDKPKDPTDNGDILIRDTGHARYCLMFPPIPKTAISSRQGETPNTLVIMIRGRHNGNEWFEVITLFTDLEEQVLDWIDILGTTPMPPAVTRDAAQGRAPALAKAEEVPLGERDGPARLAKPYPYQSHSRTVSAAEDKPPKETPSRYHTRRLSTPVAPSTPTTPPAKSPHERSSSPDRTPTQRDQREDVRSRPLSEPPRGSETTPLREDMRPDPKKLTKSPPNSKPFREDGAPPPPVHRTLSPSRPSAVNPPVELAPAPRIRRRGSSPLKHEYTPSEVSSSSSEAESDSGSDMDSSSDELDEADVPDTQPAISIKQTSQVSAPAVESVVSDDSVAPSHSASQVGLYGRLGPGGAKDPEHAVKCVASISYWSNKLGQWRDVWHEACSIFVTPGLIEAYPLSAMAPGPGGPGALNSSGSSEFGGEADVARMQPLIALELTPVVMIRQSTVVDLEVRSPVRPYCKLSTIDGKIFRFRAGSAQDGSTLYTAVHRARLNNAKYKALEEQARFRSFGQPQQQPQQADAQEQDGQSSSGHGRSWFGRKNSYRASTRAPSQSVSQSQGTSSSISAPSLLKRLTGGANMSFNIDKSSVDRHGSRPPTAAGSLYTSGSSSSGNCTPPRSPSVSLAGSSGRTVVLGSDNLKVRCHLLVTPTKWEDHGNCHLQITRPPPGMRQELRIRHGMEKRIIVTKIPKRTFGFGDSDSEKNKPHIVLDVVLGSKCFGKLGTRGIILNVWEDLRDEKNNVGFAPKTGALSGTVKKWCFQCSSTTEANWIYGLVAQEVNIGL